MNRRRLIGFFILALLFAVTLAGGCTEPPVGYEGAGRMTQLPPPAMEAMTLSLDGSETGSGTLPGLCIPDGVFCHTGAQCCNNDCIGGVTGGKQGFCKGGTVPAGGLCAVNGVRCQVHDDCCVGYCSDMGICGDTPAQVCIPSGIVCDRTQDCCFPQGGDAATPGMPMQVCKPLGSGSICAVVGSKFPPIPGETQPLCAPLDVACTRDDECCVGKCIANISGQFVCAVPVP